MKGILSWKRRRIGQNAQCAQRRNDNLPSGIAFLTRGFGVHAAALREPKR